MPTHAWPEAMVITVNPKFQNCPIICPQCVPILKSPNYNASNTKPILLTVLSSSIQVHGHGGRNTLKKEFSDYFARSTPFLTCLAAVQPRISVEVIMYVQSTEK